MRNYTTGTNAEMPLSGIAIEELKNEFIRLSKEAETSEQRDSFRYLRELQYSRWNVEELEEWKQEAILEVFDRPEETPEPAELEAPEELEDELDKEKESAPMLEGVDTKEPETATAESLDIDLLRFGAHDVGNAEALQALYGDKFAYVEAFGWLHYEDGFWKSERAKAKLTQAAIHTLKKRREQAVWAEREAIVREAKPAGYNVRNAVKLFRSLPGVTQPVDSFDNYPDHLNVANGVLNLKTGELASHSPEWKFMYRLNIPYNYEADSSLWQSFLEDVVESPKEVIPYIQELVGYSLTGRTREEMLVYLHGPTRAGKGTFTETLLALLGKPLAVEADFNTFTGSRNDTNNFDLAPLKPSRFIVASESNPNDYLNAAFIKKVTGGNDIYCSHKGKPHFSYAPQFKIWLVSNEKAKADPDDNAAWYRLKVIHFPKSFAGKEDKTLKQRLKRLESLEGVLAWAVEGAKRWYSKPNGLEAPKIVTDNAEAHRKELDEVAQFLEHETEEDPENFVTNEDLHQAYEEFCKRNGFTPKGMRSLGRSLSKKGYPSHDNPVRIAGKVHRGRYGLKLKKGIL